MNRKATKPIVLVLVFISAMITFSLWMNKESIDQTTTMDSASLPVMQFVYEDMTLNELHGYAKEMDMLSMRDGMIPMSDARQLKMVITTYGNEIDNLSYKIRSMDSERLLVEVEEAEIISRGDFVDCTIQLPSLFEDNVEYNMEITLEIDGERVHYYTRIVHAPTCYIDECLAFAKQFHEYSFRSDADTFISAYMDPATGDATTLSYVDLSCTLRQITWAKFAGKKLTEPVVSLKEIGNSYNVITLKYVMTNIGERGQIEYYNVEEYYRLRHTQTRMYILNFERTMNQIFSSENNIFNGNTQLLLGIRDNDVEFKGNDSGDCIAFVQEGDLWCFDKINNTISRVFSFRGPEGINSRENWDQHDIKIMRVDEAGSISFMVYGYMNSGIHEGSVGVGVYHYDALKHTVEEEVFIDSDKSYEVLKAELGKLVYVNEQKQLYIMLTNSAYKIDLTTFEIELLMENGNEENFAVSESGRYFAWIEPGKENASDHIVLEDLKTGNRHSITSGTNTYVRPITFIGDDFVYGIARQNEVKEDIFGDRIFPMYAIEILNTSEDKRDVIKTYAPQDGYIGDTSVDENNVHVEIVDIDNGRYIKVREDTIMNRETEPNNGIKVGKAVTEAKQTQVTLMMKERFSTDAVEVLHPMHIVVDENREVVLNTDAKDYYYVYVKGEVLLATKDVSEAVRVANANMGIVVDADLKYIFKRARNTSQTALSNLSPNEADVRAGASAKCISIMLNRESVGARVDELLTTGQKPVDILRSTLKNAKVIELKKISVDELLYFIDQGIPVYARTSATQAILLVGYSPSYIYYYEPMSGQVKSIDYDGAEKLFYNGGNYFITYVK